MPEGINLADLFSQATQVIQANKSKLNQADSYNGNHGDNMVEILDVITKALNAKKDTKPATQLNYAAKQLRKTSASGSSTVYANGLAKAAKEVSGKTISLEGALGVLQTILNGGKAEAKSDLAGDLLGSLVAGTTGSKAETQKGTDWLKVGLDLLKASKDAGIDLGALAQSLVSGTEMGKSEHRSQSGQLVTNAILKKLLSSFNK